MSMMSNEVLNVLECDPMEEEWVLVERGNKFGRVPRRMVRYI